MNDHGHAGASGGEASENSRLAAVRVDEVGCLCAQDFFNFAKREKIFQRGPGGFSPFIRIERPFAGGTLAPTLSAIPVDDAHHNDSPLSRAPKTGFEKMD